MFLKILDQHYSFTIYYFAFWFLKAHECLDATNFVVLKTVVLSKLVLCLSYRQSVVHGIEMRSSQGSRRVFPSAFRDMSRMMQSTCAVPVHWALQVQVSHGVTQLAHVTITMRCASPVCSAGPGERRLDSAAATVPARRPRSFAVGSMNYCPSLWCAEP